MQNAIFICYTCDFNKGRIYKEEKFFNNYNHSNALLKEVIYTFNPMEDFTDNPFITQVENKKEDYSCQIQMKYKKIPTQGNNWN